MNDVRKRIADDWREMRRTRPHAEVMFRWRITKAVLSAMRSGTPPASAEGLLATVAERMPDA